MVHNMNKPLHLTNNYGDPCRQSASKKRALLRRVIPVARVLGENNHIDQDGRVCGHIGPCGLRHPEQDDARDAEPTARRVLGGAHPHQDWGCLRKRQAWLRREAGHRDTRA